MYIGKEKNTKNTKKQKCILEKKKTKNEKESNKQTNEQKEDGEKTLNRNTFGHVWRQRRGHYPIDWSTSYSLDGYTNTPQEVEKKKASKSSHFNKTTKKAHTDTEMNSL